MLLSVLDALSGRRALVMGLGLHGGGVETARFLVRAGAQVTCTDLRSEEELIPSLKALEGLGIRFVLGRHREKDFDEADIIIKNPAVPIDSPWIRGRRNIETDISLFLQAASSPILAVTGSKGKSTVVSILHRMLSTEHPGARLGGNITVSPLSFLEELTDSDPVVLELSSWQLADLRDRSCWRPRIVCITNLMHDHQNRYASFSDYESDKTVIFAGVPQDGFAVFPDDAYGRRWATQTPGRAVLVGSDAQNNGFSGLRTWLDEEGRGWMASDNRVEEILAGPLRVPGKPFRLNCLFAAAMARLWGIDAAAIRRAAGEFPGVRYRMEMFLEKRGVQYFDDTTATIPEAAAAAVRAMARPVILIAGGTDKELDFSSFDAVAATPKGIVMLQGSATDAWMPRMRQAGAVPLGPFGSMETAVAAANRLAVRGDAVLLSPGAASFGMFRHEFDRGDAFKSICRTLPD